MTELETLQQTILNMIKEMRDSDPELAKNFEEILTFIEEDIKEESALDKERVKELLQNGINNQMVSNYNNTVHALALGCYANSAVARPRTNNGYPFFKEKDPYFP